MKNLGQITNMRLRFLAILIPFLAVSQAADAQKPPNDDRLDSSGAALYNTHCAVCHDDNLTGGLGPSLVDEDWVYGRDDAAIRRVIVDGLPDAGMEAYGTVLTSTEITQLVDYIKKAKDGPKTQPIVDVASVEDEVQIDTWVTGLREPWAIQFIGDNEALITEKTGALRHVKDGKLIAAPIAGTPSVVAKGQGGLLDVAIDPDYADNGWIYLSFSDPGDKGAMTKVVRGRITDGVWTDEHAVFAANPEDYIKTGYHFGSRITFDGAGYLYFSIGDRGKKDMAQDISKPNGKIHRVRHDGSIPADNPFVDNNAAYGSIYAFGNRNPQGLIIHPDTQVLWETEHGPRGGDELNAIKAGVNYGWPRISYGINYNGSVLTPYQSLPNMAQPASQWTPSIAVCGLDVYTGDLFPQWKGRLMAGALKYETVRLIDVSGDTYKSETTLIKDKGRVRDVTTGPDGAIYVALPRKIIRLTPKDSK